MSGLPTTAGAEASRSLSDAARPTQVRYEVLGWVCVLAMITYLDRAAFPNAEKQIKDAMGGGCFPVGLDFGGFQSGLCFVRNSNRLFG